MIRRPTRSTLVAYTTLFRSRQARPGCRDIGCSPAVAGDLHLLGVEQLNPVFCGPPAGLTGQVAVPQLLPGDPGVSLRSEEHTSELQSRQYLGCRLLLEKKTD